MAIAPHRYDFLGSEGMVGIAETYGDALNTLCEEMLYRGITGQVDVEEEWDSYVDRWMRSGGESLLVAMQKLPLMSALENGKIEF